MKNTPIDRKLIDEAINSFQINDLAKATIREVKAIAAHADLLWRYPHRAYPFRLWSSE